MGDAAHGSPEGFHLPRLEKLLSEPLALFLEVEPMDGFPDEGLDRFDKLDCTCGYPCLGMVGEMDCGEDIVPVGNGDDGDARVAFLHALAPELLLRLRSEGSEDLHLSSQ